MSRTLPLLLVLSLAACGPKEGSLDAQPDVAEPAGAAFETGPVERFVGDLQVHTFTLPNGLTIKVVPDRSAPVVAYQTWMGVGSAHEEEGKTGLAHLFEHMMFKGTDAYADGEFDKRLDAMGAEGMNAWTWLDQTVYIEAVPASALPDLVEIEATRFDGLVVDEAAFESEREVVINERRLRTDNAPEGRMSEVLFAEAFGTHTYGWPTVGWMKDLEALTVQDAQAFYERFYAPDNATVVVVGDVEPSEVAALVAEHYGHMEPSGRVDVEIPVEPEQTAQRVSELTLPVSSDRIAVGFKVPSYTHADIPALLVLDAALSAPLTGRLNRALVDAGYATDVGAFVMPLAHPSLYEIDVTARPGVSAETLREVLEAELARVASEGISEGELAAGKAQWKKFNWSSLEDAAGKADFLGWAMVHTGSHLDGLARIDAIEGVTMDDVKRVAEAYLTPERSTVVVARPTEAPEAVEVSAEPVAPAARVEVTARAVGDAPDLPAGEVVEREIEGATVLLTHDATLPLVHYRLHFPVGAAADPEGKEGLANLVGEMLLRGTGTYDRRAFEEAFEQLGASVAVGVDADGVTVTGSALAETWPAVLALLESALTEPAFDADELDKLRREVVDALDARKDDDRALVEAAWSRTVYGEDHPYGRDPRGTKESVSAVTAEDLQAFHATYLKSGGALVGVAGAFDAGTEADLARILGGIAGDPAEVPEIPAVARTTERKVVLVDKPERTQAQVLIGHPGLDHRDDSFPAFLLFNDGFGVGFGGRLMKEVRVERGWSYYAYSFPGLHEVGSDWSMAMAPGTDYVGDAVALVLDMAEKADAEGLTEDEFAQARTARLAKRPFLVDTASERLDLELRKRTVGYDRLGATEAMADLTLEDVNAAFSEVVDPSGLVVAVVATASDVKAQLEEKVGPVEVVPYDAL